MTKKIKTIIIAVALVLTLTLAAGLIVHFVTKDKSNIPQGGTDKPTIAQPDSDLVVIDKGNVVVDGSGNELKEGKVYSMPKNIMFYSATNATTSVQVRAVITPDNADDKRVTWESSNPYIVSVEQSASNPLVATITRKGNLVDGRETITCRSVDNPDAYATCVIDQLIGGNNLEFLGGIDGNKTVLKFGETYTVWGRWNDLSPGVGTIMGNTENVGWGLNLDYGFMQKVDEILNREGISGDEYSLCNNECSFDSSGLTGTLFSSPYECFYCGECDAEEFNHAFKLAVKECSVQATLTINGSYTYGGRTYRYGSVDIPVTFSLEGIWIGVDGVDLDNDNVIFS